MLLFRQIRREIIRLTHKLAPLSYTPWSLWNVSFYHEILICLPATVNTPGHPLGVTELTGSVAWRRGRLLGFVSQFLLYLAPLGIGKDFISGTKVGKGKPKHSGGSTHWSWASRFPNRNQTPLSSNSFSCCWLLVGCSRGTRISPRNLRAFTHSLNIYEKWSFTAQHGLPGQKSHPDNLEKQEGDAFAHITLAARRGTAWCRQTRKGAVVTQPWVRHRRDAEPQQLFTISLSSLWPAAGSGPIPLARQHSVAHTLFTASAISSALPTGMSEGISG